MTRISKKKKVSVDELPFETALLELEAVVKSLEEGDLPLEEALGRFSDGISLSRVCLEKLNAAENTIDQILLEERGKYVQKPLELGEE